MERRNDEGEHLTQSCTCYLRAINKAATTMEEVIQLIKEGGLGLETTEAVDEVPSIEGEQRKTFRINTSFSNEYSGELI
ncbi:hypothetical protein MA16_Dca022189 [Dendrobium catenatum]|uniref:Uncharacterized protein n=1 Tax=Dendrobium catenatum TaxID=906689 RepID=A0A2I0VGH4_9ASPA|nr:hypothetical protein MA16_Dca022189 [Dendrobium catenatum]